MKRNEEFSGLDAILKQDGKERKARRFWRWWSSLGPLLFIAMTIALTTTFYSQLGWMRQFCKLSLYGKKCLS